MNTKKAVIISRIYDVVEVISIAVVVVVLSFLFFFRVSRVNGTSMYDTLENGENVLISNMFYTPKSGDIVVFQQSGGFFDEPLVKRVIAVGGQKLEIDFNTWTVYVDGVPLVENYVTRDGSKVMHSDDYYSMYAGLLDESGAMTIPEGYVFVMGDNRNHSSHSRFSGVGLVNTEDIMGKLIFRLTPIGKIGTVE